MGLLDDAIREHLDLKRKHGAAEEELQRQQEEALGPARRDVAPAEQPDGDGTPEAAEGEATEAVDVPAELAPEAEELEPEPSAEPAAGPPPEPAQADAEIEAPIESRVEEEAAHVDEPAPLDESAPLDEPISLDEPAPLDEPVPLDEPTQVAEPSFEPPLPDPEALEPKADHPPVDPLTPLPPESAPTQPGDTPRSFEALDEDELHDEPEEPGAEEGSDESGEEGADVLEDTPDFLQETPEHDRLWFEQKPPRDFDFD